MITDSFDNQSPAKINVGQNENAIPVDAVIFTFSQEIEKHVIAAYDCEKVGEFLMGCGPTSVYVLKYHGRQFGFYRTWVGAPACVAPIEELATVLRTRKIIHFGGAGCLNREIARGKVMIPTEAYRDEGTSYHYAPAADYIQVKNWETVRDFMEANGAISAAWRSICFSRAETCWTRRNGPTGKRPGRLSIRSMTRGILILPWRLPNMLRACNARTGADPGTEGLPGSKRTVKKRTRGRRNGG